MSDGTETDLGTSSNLPIRIEIPGYRLRRQIGEDAIGLWFDAEQESLGRKVTIKALKPKFEHHEAARRQFLAEMDRIAPLEHENLIRVLDMQREEPLVLVTDRIGIKTLAAPLQPGKPLGEATALDHARQIAAGLLYLTERDLAHKNVTPRLVALRDDDRCKLITFRNIVTPDELAALRGKLAQDARYIAPEQLAGEEPIGPKAHVYHVGCLLFHMLAGRPPHTESDVKALAKAHLTEPFPSLKRLQPFLTAGLHDFVAACGQRSPDARPDLADVVDAIRQLRSGKNPGIKPTESAAKKKKGGIVAPTPRRRRRRRR
jgi:serine/threonine-protein kinase